MLTSYPADRLHDEHPPPPASEQSRHPAAHNQGGVNFGRRSPGSGGQICTPKHSHPAQRGEPAPLTTDLHASFDLVRLLNDSTVAGHEWAGLVGYRLMGWTRELFPAPTSQAPTG